jgi:hypothetical protein
MARIRCTARKYVIPFCLLAWRSVHCVARCQVSPVTWRDCIVACTRSRSADARSRTRSSRTLPPRHSGRWSLRGRLPLHLSQRCSLHHHRASQLLEETLMETTTTPVAVRATTRSSRRSRSRRDGSLDPSLLTLLAGVTFTTLSTPCCVGPSTWSVEYRCVVYQHRRRLYPDQWEATCLVRRPYDNLRGEEAFSEHYSITERDTAEAAM